MVRLTLDDVTYRAALKGVSLSVGDGEMIAVFAERKSDRSALLRVAGGVDAPDNGSVQTNGLVVFAQRSWPALGGPDVIGQLTLPLLARRSVREARAAALGALVEWGVVEWSGRRLCEMADHELARLSLIRAVTSAPDLLLVDDPTADYGPGIADQASQILRAARGRGCAVLVTASELEPMTGADQIYTLSEGTIRGRKTADIVEFPSRTTA
jgi:ABC-type lipoprotein export system ATPase subunit